MRAPRLMMRMAMVLTLSLAAIPAASAAERPELPRAEVDVSPLPNPRRTLEIGARGNLQAALDKAQPGDAIVLTAGATYRGPFTLPRKPEGGWIVIRGEEEASRPGSRIQPHGVSRPRLAASTTVIRTAPGAHHYRFVGLEIAPSPGAFLHNVIQIGDGKEAPEDLPHHIIIERCYVHGDARVGSRRGIALNGAHLAVVDSFVADFKERGADSQAVAGWGGPGPILLQNNYLEGAAENVMFGGADPSIPGLVPSDITIRKNRLAKLLTWNRHLSDADDTGWTIKNLFELKNARRVLVEGNLLENSWPESQAGFAIVLTVRNQDLSAPWSTIQDVTFRNNIVRNAGAGVNILGRDDNGPSVRAERIAFVNNAFVEIGASRGSGILFQILDDAAHLAIENNTSDQTGAVIMAAGAPHTGFVFRRNITPHNEFGVIGTGTRPGLMTLETYFPRATFEENVLRGGSPDLYPSGNQFHLLNVTERVKKTRVEPDRRIGVDLEVVCAALSPQDVPIDICSDGPLAMR